MKNLEHFIKLIEDINLQNEVCNVSFDTVSLLTNIPMEEVLQVIRYILNMDCSFPEHSLLQAEDVMELLDICLTTTYFQFEDTFCQQKRNGMAMEKSLSLVVSNIFMDSLRKWHWIQQTTNPLNGSDMSTLSRFGHMDQQDYSNFFIISTAFNLRSNSQWKLKLMIPLYSWMFWS
jgi:hypothetical protein